MRWSILLVVVACGRVDFDPVTGPDSDTACWRAWKQHAPTVGVPRELTELRPGEISGDPFPTTDGHTLYFISDGTADIYYATRVNIDDAWTDRGMLPGVNSTGIDTKLTVTEDGLAGVLSTNGFTGADADLVLATRAIATDDFALSPADPILAGLNTSAREFDPHITPAGLSLYYAPDLGTGQIIIRATRPDRTAPFVIDRTLTELARDTTYADPALSPDELVIAYTGTTTGVLFYATRGSTDELFGTPVQIPAVNDASRQADVELSADGCELYFASTRTGTKRIFVSTITP